MSNEDMKRDVEWVRVSDIHTDPRVNTRPVDEAWVASKKDTFDPFKLGLPLVSRRDDNTYVCLDGQNRVALLRAVGWGDQCIQCQVMTGLTVPQEADLFLGHNDRRDVKKVYKFLAEVTAQKDDSVEMNRIVRGAGWRVGQIASGTTISAVAALERIYQADLREKYATLARTLYVVTEAWGRRPEAVRGQVLLGIAGVLRRYRDQIDVALLVKKLSTSPGPDSVYGMGRNVKDMRGGTVASGVSEVVVSLYNKGRRVNLLNDWR
jgi:hypothetical protein